MIKLADEAALFESVDDPEVARRIDDMRNTEWFYGRDLLAGDQP